MTLCTKHMIILSVIVAVIIVLVILFISLVIYLEKIQSHHKKDITACLSLATGFFYNNHLSLLTGFVAGSEINIVSYSPYYVGSRSLLCS